MDRVTKRKKKRRAHPFRTIFILAILAICAYLGYEYKVHGNLDNVAQIFSKIDFKKYNVVEATYSSNNLIEGQQTVEGKDRLHNDFYDFKF